MNTFLALTASPARLLASVLLAGGVVTSSFAAPPPSAEVRRFADFLYRSAPLCEAQPARRCVDVGWAFADRDGDGRVSAPELEAVRGDLRSWLSWPENGIRPQERRGVQLGLMVVEAVGLSYLVDSYDADGDGALSRAELLSDVRLDGRPLGKVLQDPDAVDWDGVKRKLGALAPMLGGLGASSAP